MTTAEHPLLDYYIVDPVRRCDRCGADRPTYRHRPDRSAGTVRCRVCGHKIEETT